MGRDRRDSKICRITEPLRPSPALQSRTLAVRQVCRIPGFADGEGKACAWGCPREPEKLRNWVSARPPGSASVPPGAPEQPTVRRPPRLIGQPSPPPNSPPAVSLTRPGSNGGCAAAVGPCHAAPQQALLARWQGRRGDTSRLNEECYAQELSGWLFSRLSDTALAVHVRAVFAEMKGAYASRMAFEQKWLAGQISLAA